MKQDFFVGIKDPVRARRDLLTASKGIIDSLKRYGDFSALHEDKQKYTFDLKRVVDELIVLNKKLRGHLPKTPLKGTRKSKKAAKKSKSSRKTHMVETKTKLELLEEELSKVESRLKTLE